MLLQFNQMNDHGTQSNDLVNYEPNSCSNTTWQPKFLDDDGYLQKEYKDEWRTYLAMKNWEQISGSMSVDKRVLRFSFYSKTVIKRVFDICELMRQAPEVRYLALDILDRFMILHFFNVTQAMKASTDRTKEIWKTVVKRMVNQTFSRVLSCIQLASKYCRSTRVLTYAEIEKLLISSCQKYSFSRRELVRSEARVYKTLKYKIPLVTPLTYVEMFFEDFRNDELKEHLQISLSSFLNICVHVLDIAFIFHKDIYRTLYCRLTGKPYLILKDPQFLSVEADYMYLAVSVIYTAATIQDPTRAIPFKLLKFFSSVTQYKPEEIDILGKIILDIIIDL